MRPALEPLPALNSRSHSPLEVAYQQYRLERQGDRLSAATLDHYDWIIGSFVRHHNCCQQFLELE